jgi:hypothetical protein
MGERRKAQVHRTTAMAMCREMDMRFWSVPVEV